MEKSCALLILIALLLTWLVACSAPRAQTISPAGPVSPLCSSIQRGLGYLHDRFNPNLGLLNESPQVAPHTYWLTNDNALAAFAFAQLNQPEMTATLTGSLQRYGHSTNGLIETVWGKTVAWPPYVEQYIPIEDDGQDKVWQESHEPSPNVRRFDDWEDYSNLAFLGALNKHNQGDDNEARAIFAKAIKKFDGIGFPDKAFTDNRYETYKLALALYVGSKISASLDNSAPAMLATLKKMQASNGGFYTHYRDLQTPDGDTNTETTSYALLALARYGCSD
ncbi:MAG: hypothetical protein HZB51_23705 [Chloroflexi bacterium]|nr:hypothetical protein [Chloroflexota bacterium]